MQRTAHHAAELDQLDPSRIFEPSSINKPRIPTSLVVGISVILAGMSPIAYGLSAALMVHHPLEAIALTPNSVFIMAGASRVFLITLLLIATVRLSIATPLQYILGRRAVTPGPKQPARWLKRPRNWVADRRDKFSGLMQWIVDRVNFGRYGLALIFLFPTAKTMLLAGAYSLPRMKVAMTNAAGKVVRLVGAYYLGSMIPLNSFLQQCLVHLRP